MTSTMPAQARTALEQMARGVRLQRVKSGWILFPLDAALPIRLPQTAAQWIIASGYVKASHRTPTRGWYEITASGRARLEWEDER